jgi:hypothetical protein
MANKPTIKTKTLLLNLDKDSALVLTDDGLVDMSDYETEWRLIQAEGDRAAFDYADEAMMEDCE